VSTSPEVSGAAFLMSSSQLCDELVEPGSVTRITRKLPVMQFPIAKTSRRANRPPSTRRLVTSPRLGRVAVSALLSGSLMVGVAALAGPAGAAGADSSAAVDEIVNSADGKKDRTGAPSGGNLVALKIDAATDVAKRQRILDRLAADLAASPADCGSNAALTTRVADTSVVLNEIAGRIAAATDMKVAKAAAGELFPATRVLSLVLPQVGASLSCASSLSQVQQLQARVAQGVASLDAVKTTPEGQAAIVQGGAASAALKAVPLLAPTANAVAPLLPDQGDPGVLASNAAAIATARTQVRAAEAAMQSAERAVREFDRLSELAKRKAARTTKVKKPVK
jgi:hypothetical protein